MREITKLILHCSDSDNPRHDNVETITQWHIERGFYTIGYNYVILKEGGKIRIGRPIESPGAHVKGHNANSIGVCLTGSKIFTDEQFRSCAVLIHYLLLTFDLSVGDIYPHNELNPKKTCPNFNIYKEVIDRVIKLKERSENETGTR